MRSLIDFNEHDPKINLYEADTPTSFYMRDTFEGRLLVNIHFADPPLSLATQ